MLFIYLLLPSIVAALLIPQPSGDYGVSLLDFDLVDTSRPDPYSKALERKIPISIITPISPAKGCHAIQEKYMPEATALYWEEYFGSAYNLTLNNTFSQVALSLCEPARNDEQFPLVLFSPALGISRQIYHILATNIASQGYTVVTIDAPGEMGLTTYLDGTTQAGTANFTTLDQYNYGVEVRVQDVKFVLQSLTDLAGFACGFRHGQRMNESVTLQPAIFGHSYGGATALSAILASPNALVGGANLDGAFWGAPLVQSTDKPFLLFQSDNPLKPHDQADFPNWATVWPNLHGPKWQLKLINSTHPTFLDLRLLLESFGLLDVSGLNTVLGSIEPHKALSAQVSVLSALAAYLSGQRNVEYILDIANGLDVIVVENATNIS